jgi:hypothetical protein
MTKQKNEKLNQMFFLFISSLVMSSGCKKDKEPTDPSASLSNQLVCKIDRVEWKSNEVIVRLYDNTGNGGGKYFFLFFINGTQSVQFIINSPFKTGNLFFNQNTTLYPNTLSPKDYAAFVNAYSNLTPEQDYITNTTETGNMNILTIDTIQKAIKASFSFSGKDSRTGKKTSVTDGRLEYHQ